MLPVIIWSPLEQYNGIISRECPKCKMNGFASLLVPTDWTDGQTCQNEPRLLHCVNTNVLLVTRVYTCPSQHRVLGHHPDIISMFDTLNLQCMVPFRLWHITGFTNSLIDYIDDLCQSGVPLQHIGMLSAN